MKEIIKSENENEYRVEKYLRCQCQSLDHLVVVYLDQDLDFEQDDLGFGLYSDLHINVQMSSYLPWWRRVWIAFKYVFKLNIGEYVDMHWDCCMVRDDDIDDLIDILQKHKESLDAIDEWHKERINK